MISAHWKNIRTEISLETSFSNQYDAGGKDALVDGLRGPNNYLSGRWQGFYGEDFESIVDLGSKEPVTYLNIGAIQDVRSWIWLPKKVEFLASNNGKIFKSIGTLMHSVSDNSSESIIKQFELKLKTISQIELIVFNLIQQKSNQNHFYFLYFSFLDSFNFVGLLEPGLAKRKQKKLKVYKIIKENKRTRTLELIF